MSTEIESHSPPSVLSSFQEAIKKKFLQMLENANANPALNQDTSSNSLVPVKKIDKLN